MSTLGCVDGYSAMIISKEGIPLGDLPVTSVSWSRRLDDISEAKIEVNLSGSDCPPCEVISKIGVWHHELYLFRDGLYVWSGPIVMMNVSRTKAVITARDLFQLLDRRLIHEQHCFAQLCGTAATELVDIAEVLLADAFAVDDHEYQLVKFNQTGLLGERLYQPAEHAWDVFQEELKLGLDATVLGKRIIVGAVPFGRIATLTQDDFLVDLEFEIDGLNLATRVITKGEGVIGLCKAAGSDVNGEHPYYGLLEFEGNDRQELDTQELADQGACAVLAGKFPAPVTLIVPDGAFLSPNAPVDINELVPGVGCVIIATDLCLETSGDYILLGLDVTWDPASGEQVATTFGSSQSANSGEGTT